MVGREPRFFDGGIKQTLDALMAKPALTLAPEGFSPAGHAVNISLKPSNFRPSRGHVLVLALNSVVIGFLVKI